MACRFFVASQHSMSVRYVFAAIFVAMTATASADFFDEFDTTDALADHYGYFGLFMFPSQDPDPNNDLWTPDLGDSLDDFTYPDQYSTVNNAPQGMTFGPSSFDLDEAGSAVDMVVGSGQDGHFNLHQLARQSEGSRFDITQGAKLTIDVTGLDPQFFISTPRNPVTFGFSGTGTEEEPGNPSITVQLGAEQVNQGRFVVQRGGTNADLPGGSLAPTPPLNFFADSSVEMELTIDDDSYGLIIRGSEPETFVPVEYTLIPDTLHGLTLIPGEQARPFFGARRVFGQDPTIFSVNSFSGEVIASSILAGDYNDDGVVNAADYNVWRDNLGANIALPNEDPNATTPGVVDQEDYGFWKSAFGNMGVRAVSGGTTIPEPTSALLLLLVAPLLISRDRPRFRKRYVD